MHWTHPLMNSKIKTIASDFDDSLCCWEQVHIGWGPSWNNEFVYTWNTKLINELLEFQANGYIINIVTFRGPSSGGYNKEEYGIDKYVEELKDKFGLIINEVFYTDRTSKLPFLKQMNAERFYDDYDSVVCEIALMSDIHPTFIKHGEIKNCTLQLLIDNGEVDVMEVE